MRLGRLFPTRELTKYTVAGILAFSCDAAVLFFCTELLGWHYLVSNLFGYFVGMIVAYTLNARWVFSHHRYRRQGVEFALFNLIVLVSLLLNQAFMFALIEVAGAHYLWAKVITTGIVFVGNYLARKFLLFEPSGDTAEPRTDDTRSCTKLRVAHQPSSR